MSDPLGGDVFDVESLAEAEIEKLLKQVCDKCLVTMLWDIKMEFNIFMARLGTNWVLKVV
jgi:hypothetical protein